MVEGSGTDAALVVDMVATFNSWATSCAGTTGILRKFSKKSGIEQ